jgi:hypothetical protein
MRRNISRRPCNGDEMIGSIADRCRSTLTGDSSSNWKTSPLSTAWACARAA